MKQKWKVRSAILAGSVASLIAMPLAAVEIITQQDFVSGVVKSSQLVKVADNAIFLLDTSSSTNDKFADSGLPIVQVMKNELKERNAYFPDIGINVGIYTFTDWQDNYPVGPYNREAVAAALDSVRDKGRGPTPLNSGLKKLGDILEPLTGKTAVFVFWDGGYTGQNPADTARELAAKDDVCFYVISSAKPDREATLTADVATLNSCSRVIPLADFFNHPEYTTGVLWDVKVTEHIVTTTETKIVGLEVNNINFATDESVLMDKDKAELDELAAFVKGHPNYYAVIAGYTDNAGTAAHNVGLSHRRTDMVATYLKEKHGWTDSQMVLLWYGAENPIVPNTSPANMAQNRRVEIAIGGI